MKIFRAVLSWAIALWTCKVFLQSLPYKFTKHPDTEHIFGTIGRWMSDTINASLGSIFSDIGSYLVGSAELIVSLILLSPAAIWALRKIGNRDTAGMRAHFHAIGGIMASVIMAGAVFFHLFTPLGIEVLHEGESDGGSLFYAAVSILIGGIVLFLMNFKHRKPVQT